MFDFEGPIVFLYIQVEPYSWALAQIRPDFDGKSEIIGFEFGFNYFYLISKDEDRVDNENTFCFERELAGGYREH